jgi:hypothetical protein
MFRGFKMSILRVASDNIFCANGQSNFRVSAGSPVVDAPWLDLARFNMPVAPVLLLNLLRLFKMHPKLASEPARRTIAVQPFRHRLPAS